jgi:6-carboxyhexanoate--CoA ligase
MSQKNLYSIRMHASDNGRHVSGAERITTDERIDIISQELVMRAIKKMPAPEKIIVKIEKLGDIPRHLVALDVVTINVFDMATGRSTASRVLQSVGVSVEAARKALESLSGGATPSGGNMQGAMIMDAQSGDRLENDHDRGVRASRFDWSEEAAHMVQLKLAEVGLTHYRTREALALATKVAYAPGMIAELCWSDELDYTAGYVASLSTGYVRFPSLKLKGDPRGGRVFFVNGKKLDMGSLTRYLQADAVLVVEVGRCNPAVEPEEYFINKKKDEGNNIPIY